MKSILKKMSNALQLVLAAPVKLPAKVTQVVKYVAVALGILDAVIDDKSDGPQTEKKEERGETAD